MNRVKLIGQVTGAEGRLLQKASDYVISINFLTQINPTWKLEVIDSNRMSNKDQGEIFLFEG